MRVTPPFCPTALAVLVLNTALVRADTYYVDYSSGDDGKSGRKPEEAWKHAPGDPQAREQAASVMLGSGNTVQFRSGVVYRGSVIVPAGGEEGSPLVYKGTGWGEGRAIMDGSEVITGWRKCESVADAGGNPNFANLYYAELSTDSPFDLNLHEEAPEGGRDTFLHVAQSPNPGDPFFNDRVDSFYRVKQSELNTTSVTAPEVFTNGDSGHFEGASLLLWVQPNFVKRVDITGFEPSAHRVTFGGLKPSDIYSDGRDQFYAVFNSPHAIDRAGEYSVGQPDASGKRRVVLWPLSAENPEGRISRSVRERAFLIAGMKAITIEGFVLRKFAGSEDSGGGGVHVRRAGKTGSSGVVVRDNVIHNNASGKRGVGGVFLTGVTGALIENNDIQWNKNTRAIFAEGCENVTIRSNYVAHAGRTAVVMYTGKNSLIVNNRIDSILSTHANALTLYIACENVVVAGNIITNSTNPITVQDSGPLYFFNNVADGVGKFSAFEEWPNTKRGPWTTGRIVLLNNSFVNSKKGTALNVGKDSEKKYVVINNILHGLVIPQVPDEEVIQSHNIFTSAKIPAKSANSRLDEMGALFVDPEKQDFQLKPGGAAIGTGADVSEYYPKDVFPHVDFDEIAGRTSPMNIGAEGKTSR